ncbi:MAG: right-handed parallel beta-helix repeat-containing protein [Carboxylicivirga sp.]|jgi:hypothetical protein|nr:right-handed parallel beta-helix repeat-containing protein [Carboxylicivirga sp.]
MAKNIGMIFNKLILLFILGIGTCYGQTTYYVSNVSGDDANEGSESEPFKTIQHAAEIMESGDICLIKQGVYRETVTPPTGGLTFKNFERDYVVVTGLDIVNNWTHHSGSIYKASVLDSVTMVFVNGKHMDWARYPNHEGNKLSKGDMMEVDLPNANPVDYGKVIMPNEPDFPANHWKGGIFHGVAGEGTWWTGLRGQIVSSSGNQLQCEDYSFNWTRPQSGFGGLGRGFIIGAFNAMDTGKEWIWQNEELFYYTEDGQDINSIIVEARVRLAAFDLSDKDNIKLEGLHIKAGNILMPSANNCSIIGCTLKYSGSFANFYIDGHSQREAFGDYEYSGAGISIGGKNNLVKDTYVGYSWVTGISLWGDSNTVDNCIVEECNWMGERYSLIQSLGDDNTITNNSLSRAGRDGIDLGHNEFGLRYSRRATVKYNTVFNVAYLSPDSGYIYVHHRRGTNELGNSELAYNILNGYHSPTYFSGHGGIYLDGGSSGYTIHHNVIMNCKAGVKSNNIKFIHQPNHNFIFNNTFVNVKIPVRLNTKEEAKANLGSVQVVAKNNLSTDKKAKYLATELANNLEVSETDLSDIENFKFHLVAGSAAIDAGKVIQDPVWPDETLGVTGITDGFLGLAPDVGAFEFGVEPWKAGGDLGMPILLDELGFLDELIDGIVIDEDVIDDAVAFEEAKAERARATRWQTSNEDIWLLTDYSALNQARKKSLGETGGMAFRKIFDLVPNETYRMTFTYDFSNKANATGTGVIISAHDGELTADNYSNLGSKKIITNVKAPEKEKGTAVFEFTPISDTAYIVVHKVGEDALKAKVEVSRLKFEY